jgi:hypothetical protein
VMAGVRQHLQRVIMEHELSPILMKLVGSDRRSIGKANEVVTEVIAKGLKPSIIEKLEVLTREGSPAMQSRGRKLLSKLKGK